MSLKTALGAALSAALLALAAPTAGANVQVGSSGWQWGNPLPQGNTLRATSFAGTTGYAAGDVGTLLKTTDGGASWSGLPVGTLAGLTVVQTLDANTVFAGGGCVARRSTDGGATFTAVRFAAVESGCRSSLRDLSFVSANVGYVLLDNGAVFTTTDGGSSIAQRTAVPDTRARGGSAAPGAIAFLDASKGFAASAGTLFETLDGGNSWSPVAAPDRTIRGIWFADALHGFVVGDGGLLLRTDDGGATWNVKNLGVPGVDYTSIRCAGTQLCILTTAGGAQLVRTTDGGDGLGTAVTPSTDPIHAAAFASPTRVVALGEHGSTVVSDDAGVRFAPVGGRIDDAFSVLRAGGASGTAFAAGANGALAKTSDGGRTWSTGIDVPTTADLRDVAFPSASVGYALDVDGALFHTTSGGAAWESLDTGSTRRPLAVAAPDASTVLVVGPRGIRRSADAGRTFDQVRARAVLRAALAGVARAHAGGAIFAWGPATLVRSTDRGRGWTALPRPGRGVRIAQAAFANAKAGLLRDTRGRVWRTANAGRSWTPLTAVGTEDVTGMVVDSARVATLVVGRFGWLVGGYLLHSDDGGATWQPQFVVADPVRPSGLVSGGGVDYLLAGDASLLSSTSGGVVGEPSELTLATRRRRPAKAGRITVTGRLQPAGRAQVTVSELAPGAAVWQHQTVSVAANGTFTTGWSLRRGTTTFVAQWTGDFRSAGAGSKPLTVTVGPSARR